MPELCAAAACFYASSAALRYESRLELFKLDEIQLLYWAASGLHFTIDKLCFGKADVYP
jgi:hypothetical protein